MRVRVFVLLAFVSLKRKKLPSLIKWAITISWNKKTNKKQGKNHAIQDKQVDWFDPFPFQMHYRQPAWRREGSFACIFNGRKKAGGGSVDATFWHTKDGNQEKISLTNYDCALFIQSKFSFMTIQIHFVEKREEEKRLKMKMNRRLSSPSSTSPVRASRANASSVSS